MTDALQAGRELDALVAALIMRDARCWHWSVSVVEGSLVRCDGCGEEFGSTTLAMARSQLPFYTTFIADAWQVVEKMRAEGWGYKATASPDSTHHYVEFVRAEGGAPFLPVIGNDAGPSVPLAICKAALSAIESDRGAE